jgi:hypothetical protein
MRILLVLSLLFVIVGGVFAQNSDPLVARHQFTTAIADREPVDTITDYAIASSNLASTSIFYFTELKNMQSFPVKHVWKKNGVVINEMAVNAGSARWRTYSSMRSAHFKAGDIVMASVEDTNGTVYVTDTLTIK